MENCNGLAIGGVLTRAAGTAQASAELHLAQGLPPGPKTLGADKSYDSRRPVMEPRAGSDPSGRPERLRH
jgi:hypothetical protein